MATIKQSKTYIKITTLRNKQRFIFYIKRENDVHTLTQDKDEAFALDSNFEGLPYSINTPILEDIKNKAENICFSTSYNGVAYYLFNRIDIQKAIKRQLSGDFKIEIVTEISENIEICD